MLKKLPLILLLFFAISQAHAQSGLCDTAYWNHTYANDRLKVYDSCYTVTGTIKLLLPPTLTADGDYHIYVHVDPQYYWMCYYRDTNYLKLCEGSGAADTFPGDLNVEEICKGAVTTTGGLGAIETNACIGFNDTVYLPNTGEYVQVTGPYVYDTVHCWNELHPVSKMVVIPAGISEPSGSIIDGLKIFPQPAGNELSFQFAHPPHAITFVKLYNIAGQVLFVYAMAETSLLKVDVSTWPAGEYLYSIVTQENSKELKSGKFSVVH